MQNSILFEMQVALGGSIGEYHGWRVLADYGDPEGEFAATRERSGLFDASMFGRIVVKGNDRIDLLHRLSSNDLLAAEIGSVLPTLFLTDKGKIVDRTIVVVREDSLLLVTSPGREETLKHWIDRYTITEDLALTAITSTSVMFYLVGPETHSSIKRAFGDVPEAGRSINAAAGAVAIAREPGRSGEGALLVFVSATEAAETWKTIAGPGQGSRAIGSTAYETARIVREIPMVGGEILEGSSPYDAGLKSDISFTKGCYIGQEVIARIDTYQKVRRGLAGIRSGTDMRTIADRRLFHEGKEIGAMTSIAPLLVEGESRGLCIVTAGEATAGATATLGETGPEVTVMAGPA
jgi:tRNA-modifying protein YgfZ